MLTRWQGKTVDVAMAETDKVDAVSGATITSTGVNDMLVNNLAEYAEFLNDCQTNNCAAPESDEVEQTEE